MPPFRVAVFCIVAYLQSTTLRAGSGAQRKDAVEGDGEKGSGNPGIGRVRP